MSQIRTYAETDYPALVALRNEIEREPTTPALMQENDQRSAENPNVIWTRLLAEEADGSLSGYVNVSHGSWLPANHFAIYTIVRADRQRRGVGGRLLAAAEAWAQDRGACEFTAFVRGDADASYRWALAQGYHLDLQRTESVLDLRQWDGAKFAGHLDRVRQSGLELLALPGVESEELLRGIYELDVATGPDVPDYEGHTPSWEDWRHDFVGYKGPKVIALGLDGGRVVGLSNLSLPRAEGAGAYTEYTAVLREYRGRGLALALKLLTIEEALAHGAPHMRTNNDEENPAMLAVNAKLGYQMVPGPRRMKKRLPSA